MKNERVVRAEIYRYRLLSRGDQPQAEICVWFTCTNCGRKHRVREIATALNFDIVFYSRKCGTLRVSMPWEPLTVRVLTAKANLGALLAEAS